VSKVLSDNLEAHNEVGVEPLLHVKHKAPQQAMLIAEVSNIRLVDI